MKRLGKSLSFQFSGWLDASETERVKWASLQYDCQCGKSATHLKRDTQTVGLKFKWQYSGYELTGTDVFTRWSRDTKHRCEIQREVL